MSLRDGPLMPAGTTRHRVYPARYFPRSVRKDLPGLEGCYFLVLFHRDHAAMYAYTRRRGFYGGDAASDHPVSADSNADDFNAWTHYAPGVIVRDSGEVALRPKLGLVQFNLVRCTLNDIAHEAVHCATSALRCHRLLLGLKAAGWPACAGEEYEARQERFEEIGAATSTLSVPSSQEPENEERIAYAAATCTWQLVEIASRLRHPRQPLPDRRSTHARSDDGSL